MGQIYIDIFLIVLFSIAIWLQLPLLKMRVFIIKVMVTPAELNPTNPNALLELQAIYCLLLLEFSSIPSTVLLFVLKIQNGHLQTVYQVNQLLNSVYYFLKSIVFSII